MTGERTSVATHLVVSSGDFTSESLAAALNHIARYADTADAIQFTEDGVFDATDRCIESLTQMRDSASYVRGARHW